MNRIFIAFVFIFLVVIASAQPEITETEDKKDFFVASAGFMYNHPKNNAQRIKEINYHFIPDLTLDFGYAIQNSKHSGWLFFFGLSTKNYKYSKLDQENNRLTHSAMGLGDFYYQVMLKKSFHVRLSKKTQGVVSAGPVLLFNRQEIISDSLRQSISPNSDLIENVNAFGAGFNIAVHFEKKINEKRHAFIGCSYQRGIVDLMKITIVNTNFNSISRTFNFTGSGPAIKVGLMF